MIKKDIVAAVALRTANSQAQVQYILDAFFETVTESLARDEPITITGFGRFSTVRYSARKGHNPQTMEPLDIPAGRRARFTPGIGIERALKVQKQS